MSYANPFPLISYLCFSELLIAAPHTEPLKPPLVVMHRKQPSISLPNLSHPAVGAKKIGLSLLIMATTTTTTTNNTGQQSINLHLCLKMSMQREFCNYAIVMLRKPPGRSLVTALRDITGAESLDPSSVAVASAPDKRDIPVECIVCRLEHLRTWNHFKFPSFVARIRFRDVIKTDKSGCG
jgi:hypothetical protein